MRVVTGYPPNYKAIKAAFNPGRGTVFAYGDTIFAPDGGAVPEHLKCHEAVHARQQGTNITAWWDRYIADPAFRLAQEVEAYGVQYAFIVSTVKDREKRNRYLREFATALSGPLYGSLCSFGEAIGAIRKSASGTTHEQP